MLEGVFRFKADGHVYTVGGQRALSITQLLTVSGEADDEFFTEESGVRGTIVHRLTADLDLGAADLATDGGIYRPYLLAYAEALATLRPQWSSIEEPFIHRQLRFAGTPDRVGLVRGAQTVAEIKSGEFSKAHQTQTAMQAILVADSLSLPPELIQRMAIYLKPTGRVKVELHPDPADFSRAREIIYKYAA